MVERYLEMKIRDVLFLLLIALMPIASASIVQNSPNNFTIDVNNIQIKTLHPFGGGNDYYWELYSGGTPISYWTKVKVERCKKVGANCDWTQTLEELMISVSSNRVSDTLLYQNYTTDQGSKFNITFKVINGKVKLSYDINGALASPIEYQVTFETHYIPSQIQNNSAQKRVKIGNGNSLVYNYADELVYPPNSSTDTNGKVYRQWFRTGLGGTVKHIDPTIEGGAQGTVSITQTGLTNGSWINLTALANATAGTVRFTDIIGAQILDYFDDLEYGNNPTWLVKAGSFVVNNKALTPTGVGENVITTNFSNSTNANAINISQVEYNFTFNIGSSTENNIQFMITNKTNTDFWTVGCTAGSFYYEAVIHSNVVRKCINGALTNLFSLPLYNQATNYNGSLRINGSGVRFVQDGVIIGEALRDSAGASGFNRIYIFAAGTSSKLADNITVYDISSNSAVEVYAIPQGHPVSEKKLITSGTSATLNVSITTGVQVQNTQLFTNSTLPYTATVNYTVAENSTQITSQCSNGFCTINDSFIPSNQVYNLTIMDKFDNPTFTGALHKGTLSYTSNLSGNVTGSGYNATHAWVNFSYVAAGFNLTVNFTRHYNNAPVVSVANTTCVFGDACTITVTNLDTEGNALNISTTVNGTKKYGASPDYSGLVIGNYSSVWNATDFNGTLTVPPYTWSNGSFWLNITEDVTPPTVTINVPSTGQIYNTTFNYSTDINYIMTDNVEIGSCWYSLNSAANNSMANCTTNFTVTSINGTNTITVYANDTNGNEASDTNTYALDIEGYPNATNLSSNSVYIAINTAFTLSANSTMLNNTAFGNFVNISVSPASGCTLSAGNVSESIGTLNNSYSTHINRTWTYSCTVAANYTFNVTWKSDYKTTNYTPIVVEVYTTNVLTNDEHNWLKAIYDCMYGTVSCSLSTNITQINTNVDSINTVVNLINSTLNNVNTTLVTVNVTTKYINGTTISSETNITNVNNTANKINRKIISPIG